MQLRPNVVVVFRGEADPVQPIVDLNDHGFDPFHLWLGIVPDDVSLNHYRVLGLRRFETDREVIQDAADRQAAPIKRHLNGEHAREARHVLDRIDEARRVLLDEVHRREYDGQLRAIGLHVDDSPASNSKNKPPSKTRGRRPGLLSAGALALSCIIGFYSANRLSGSRNQHVPATEHQLVEAPSIPSEPHAVILAAVGTRTVAQEGHVKVACYAADPGGPREKLRFRFADRPLPNASLDNVTGSFDWTPPKNWPAGVTAVRIIAEQTATGASGSLSFDIRIEKAVQEVESETAVRPAGKN